MKGRKFELDHIAGHLSEFKGYALCLILAQSEAGQIAAWHNQIVGNSMQKYIGRHRVKDETGRFFLLNEFLEESAQGPTALRLELLDGSPVRRVDDRQFEVADSNTRLFFVGSDGRVPA